MKKASKGGSHLPRLAQVPLNPRKSPVQARSAASVDAILDATVQVLLQVGKQRLTTTRVASRAGVSVGTLYQYFPNKSALLRAVLRRHLEQVMEAVKRICREQQGCALEQMAEAVITAFLAAKMNDTPASVAFYSVSSDVDGASIVRETAEALNRALVEMLVTASNPLTKDPQLVASIMQGAMAGVSRRLLESHSPEKELPRMQQELISLISAYLEGCSTSMVFPTLVKS